MRSRTLAAFAAGAAAVVVYTLFTGNLPATADKSPAAAPAGAGDHFLLLQLAARLGSDDAKIAADRTGL